MHGSYPPGLRAWLDQLNAEQLNVAMRGPGQQVVIGGPGSGKTRALTARIGRLVADGLDPKYILAMTFTRDAAREIESRLSSLGIQGVRIGTIHSVCLELIERGAGALVRRLEVDDRNRMALEIRRLLSDMRREGEIPRRAGADVSAVERYIADCKATGPCYIHGDPFTVNRYTQLHLYSMAEKWTELCGLRSPDLVEVFRRLDERRAGRGLYTFDDMISWAWLLLITDPNLRRRVRNSYSVVIVDETQDSTPLQWDIAFFLTGLESCVKTDMGAVRLPERDEGHHSLMAGGDINQCQPEGTRVSLGKDWHRTQDIKQLWQGGSGQRGSCIASWNRKRRRLMDAREIRAASRYYTGPMLRILVSSPTGARSTQVTPEHRFLCQWLYPATWQLSVVYAMYRSDLGFRVGWCRLFGGRMQRGTPRLHLSERARIEKAERTWILSVHQGPAEASRTESFVAAKYGLPLITFEPPNGTQYYTRDGIHSIFSRLSDSNTQRGIECLEAHGRRADLPFWPWPNAEGSRRAGVMFQVHAANLIPGLMSVPLPDGQDVWGPIVGCSTTQFSGLVYSLDVAKDHSYVADGIVTLNSIYGWRSAHPDILLSYSRRADVEVIKLPVSYRNPASICHVASEIVKDREWNLLGTIKPSEEKARDLGMRIDVQQFPTAEQEAAEVVSFCQELAASSKDGYRSCAVLSRLSVALHIMELECIRRRIPYVLMASGSFSESRDVQNVLSYLRVATMTDPEGKHLKRIINTPFRMIGRRSIQEAEAAAKGNSMSLLDALLQHVSLGRKQQISMEDLYDVLRELNQTARAAEEGCLAVDAAAAEGAGLSPGPAKMIADVLDRTGYIEACREEEGLYGLDESRLAVLGELQRIAVLFHSPLKFLGYMDALAQAVRNARHRGLRRKLEEQSNALTLSTIHRFKGLERDYIFLADVARGRFPHSRAHSLEEELRLLYVAITRARLSCTISYAQSAPSIGRYMEDAETTDELSSFILPTRAAIKGFSTSVTNNEE